MASNSPAPMAQQPLGFRCLALTGSFETTSPPPGCFGCVSGDFDGQGLSYSALQWNLGQGTLQTLLIEMNTEHQEVLETVFAGVYPSLSGMLALPRDQQLAWARSFQTPHHTLVNPWTACFAALGSTPEFQVIATRHAAGIFQNALNQCRSLGLASERAAALLFDIGVQNGSIGSAVRTLIEQDFDALPAGDPDTLEVAKMKIVANRRSDAAASAWREDVRKRKLVIANGNGLVHGVHYDLAAQFGLTMSPWSSDLAPQS